MLNKLIFEMAAMPFSCNGHLLCCVNKPTVLLISFNNLFKLKSSHMVVHFKFEAMMVMYLNNTIQLEANLANVYLILSPCERSE